MSARRRRRPYAVNFTREAATALEKVRDKKIRADIVAVAAELAHAPEAQGKALTGSLEGLRSVRAARERFRVLYRVAKDAVDVVYVVFLGPRRPGVATDVYAMAERVANALMAHRAQEDE